MVSEHSSDQFYEVTVIVDGQPIPKRFPAHMKVLEAIRLSLPERDRGSADRFNMVDANVGTSVLDPSQTLEQAGVRDGHVLSITKRDGGGGDAR